MNITKALGKLDQVLGEIADDLETMCEQELDFMARLARTKLPHTKKQWATKDQQYARRIAKLTKKLGQ